MKQPMEERRGYALWPKQVAGINWMRGREKGGSGGILAHDVGMGKTVTMCTHMGQDHLWPALIVVPKSALTDWVSVIVKTPSLQRQLCVVDGPARLASSRAYELVLATHSCLRTPALDAVLRDRTWGRVVIDEAHVLKNPGTRIHKAVRKLQAHAKWLLTATPIQNSAQDLLSLARVVGVDTADAEHVRRELLLLGQNSDAELEPMHVFDHIVTMRHAEECDLYASVREGLDALVRDASDMTTAKKKSAMEVVLRCMQACTHPGLYYKSMMHHQSFAKMPEEEQLRMSRRVAHMRNAHSSKMEHLVEDLIEHGEGEKSLVFCNWTDEMAILSGMLHDRRVTHVTMHGGMSTAERREAVMEFRQAPGPRVFLLQIQCAGVALNLQDASRVYLMRPQWNPAAEKQAFGRAHRSGQTRRVTAIRLVAEGTVDELILARAANKLDVITKTLQDPSLQACLTGERVTTKTNETGETDGTNDTDGTNETDEVPDIGKLDIGSCRGQA
jgi:SNF2 family DNA or RNA helicase